MPVKIISLVIKCSQCNSPFTGSYQQYWNAQQGKSVYCKRECQDIGRRGWTWGGKTLAERFMQYTEKHTDGCLYWTGMVNAGGYGKIWADGRERLAHHVAFFLKHGYWPPPDMEIDHTCHPNTCILGVNCPHRRCVNWEHLKLLVKYTGGNRSVARSASAIVNSARLRAIAHCPQGHEYTEENTYWWNGRRKCRECRRVRGIEYRATKKAASA